MFISTRDHIYKGNPISVNLKDIRNYRPLFVKLRMKNRSRERNSRNFHGRGGEGGGKLGKTQRRGGRGEGERIIRLEMIRTIPYPRCTTISDWLSMIRFTNNVRNERAVFAKELSTDDYKTKNELFHRPRITTRKTDFSTAITITIDRSSI